MNNKSYDHSNRIGLIAPEGGVISGNFYKIGALFGAAVSSVPEGYRFTLDREGIWSVNVEADGNIEIGDQIYWEAGRADSEFSNEVTADAILAGIALGAVEAGEIAKIDVAISPMPLTVAAESLEDAGGPDE